MKGSQKKLILMTSTFPFGNGETFLETEITYLCRHFSKVIIVPTSSTSIDAQRKLPSNCFINSGIAEIKFNENSVKRRISKFYHSLTQIQFYKELMSLIPKRFSKGALENLVTYIRDSVFSEKILHSIISTENADADNTLIYTYWCTGITFGAIKLNGNLPVVSRVHGGDLYEELYPSNYIPLREKTLSEIQALICISDFGIQYLSKKHPDYSRKYYLSRLGTKVTSRNDFEFLSDQKSVVITSCSNLKPNKRVDDIARYLNIFAQKHPDITIRWNHFGSGPELNNLCEITSRSHGNLESKLMGHVDNYELLKWYNNNKVDLFINLSRSEGIPVSIMEAYSFGIPAIATDVGGTSELVNSENGWLINREFTGPEIISALEDAILNVSKRVTKGEEARKTCYLHYNSEKNYAEFTHLLKSLF